MSEKVLVSDVMFMFRSITGPRLAIIENLSFYGIYGKSRLAYYQNQLWPDRPCLCNKKSLSPHYYVNKKNSILISERARAKLCRS